MNGPENPFNVNEVIVRYQDLQNYDGHMVLGRINQKTRTDKNGIYHFSMNV